MKKTITDEKFYITDVPEDKNKIIDLIAFLDDSESWTDKQYAHALSCEFILYDEDRGYYGYAYHVESRKEYHTVITYDDLLANYLPKNTKTEPLELNNWDKPMNDAINNGGKTDYYQLSNAPFPINDFDDFAEWRKLNGNQFNIGKVVWTFNVGRHNGTDYIRDLNKIKHYADRELLRLKREELEK